MAQIVDPRRRRVTGEDDAKLRAKFAEGVANLLACEWTAVRHAEYRTIRIQCSMSSAAGVEIPADHSSQPWTERNESVLAELGPADHQNSAIPIDIVKAKTTHLTDAKAECVERREDRTVGMSPQLSAVLVGELASMVEQSLDVLGLEDDGDPNTHRSARSRLNRRPVDHSAHGQPSEQDSKHAEELVVAGRPSMLSRSQEGNDDVRGHVADRADPPLHQVSVEDPQGRLFGDVTASEGTLVGKESLDVSSQQTAETPRRHQRIVSPSPSASSRSDSIATLP